MFKKIIAGLAATIIAASIIGVNSVTAAQPSINWIGNTFTIYIEPDTDWTDIYFTYPRYSFNIYVDGEQIDTKDQNLVTFCGIGLDYGDLAKLTITNSEAIPFTLELIPTSKFRENTEVLIGGHYFLLAETEVNGCPAYGDMNRNGRIDVGDLVLLQRYLLGYPVEHPIIPWRGDVVRDGQINAFDMVGMRQLILEKGDMFNG